eukprot:6900614-Lingulodinium_polyedra.AAC.1
MQCHNAIRWTFCRRNGSQTARAPRARQFSGARMARASAQFASRCGGGRSIYRIIAQHLLTAAH